MPNPAQNVTFPSNGRTAHGYLALPPSGRGSGVIVIQEWWGLTDHVKGVTDRLAAEGFVALAPDLYGGRTTHDAAEAGRLMAALPVERAAADLSGAVDFLLAHGAVTSETVGAVGFCMGGGFVLQLASREGRRIGAAVPYYGVGPYERAPLAEITAPVLGHFAEHDEYVPLEKVRALEGKLKAGRAASVDLRIHPGAGHAFCNEENLLGTYDRELAASTFQATVAFLRKHLG